MHDQERDVYLEATAPAGYSFREVDGRGINKPGGCE